MGDKALIKINFKKIGVEKSEIFLFLFAVSFKDVGDYSPYNMPSPVALSTVCYFVMFSNNLLCQLVKQARCLPVAFNIFCEC